MLSRCSASRFISLDEQFTSCMGVLKEKENEPVIEEGVHKRNKFVNLSNIILAITVGIKHVMKFAAAKPVLVASAIP